MKLCYISLCLAIMALSLSPSPLQAQNSAFQQALTFTAPEADPVVLQFGQALDASDAFVPNEDVPIPPAPPSGFDARLINPDGGLVTEFFTDVRSLRVSGTYVLHVRPVSAEEAEVVLSWPAMTGFAGTARLEITGRSADLARAGQMTLDLAEHAAGEGASGTITIASASDPSPPDCGTINLVVEGGQTVGIEVDPSDAESGIASVLFVKLANATGTLNDTMGPYAEGDEVTFPSPYPSGVVVRGNKVDLASRSTMIIKVTNGARLSRTCDPVYGVVTADVPDRFELEQNYPNPFNPSTMIQFKVAESGLVKLRVFDTLGRLTATLVDEMMQPGTYSVEWNGLDNDGRPVSSGVYIYDLHAGPYKSSRRMVLLK